MNKLSDIHAKLDRLIFYVDGIENASYSSNTSSLTFDNNSETKTAFIDDIVADIWVEIFCFMNIKEFLLIREICKEFYKITMPTIDRINKFWQRKCKQMCCDINPNYNTNEWNRFYWELKKLFWVF